MATAAKLTDDFLRCNICMEVFKNPSTLSCQHTFCRECLSIYIQSKPDAVSSKSVPCPSCRGGTVVPNPNRPVEEWAGQFKASFLIVGMMDSLHQPEKALMDSPSQPETKHCSVCKNTHSVSWYWCFECQALFCGQCLILHSRMPYSSNHEMTQHREGERVRKPFVCHEHGEKIKLFCKDCRKCLCTLCCSIYHRRCEVVVTLKEMLPVVKKETEDHQKNLSKMQEQKLRDQDDITDKVELINGRNTNIKEEIKEVFESLRTLLDQKERDLIDTVDDKLKGPIGQLKTEIENTEQDMNLLKKNSQVIQNALEQGDEVQLFDIYQSLDSIPSQRSDDQNDVPCSFPRDSLEDPCVNPIAPVLEQCSHEFPDSQPCYDQIELHQPFNDDVVELPQPFDDYAVELPQPLYDDVIELPQPLYDDVIELPQPFNDVTELPQPFYDQIELYPQPIEPVLESKTEHIKTEVTGSQMDINHKPGLAKISFIHDMHQLREMFDEMEIRVTY